MDFSFLMGLIHLSGAVLLVVTGVGSGFALCQCQLSSWRQLQGLARLLDYLQGLLSYQSLTGQELLQRAALYPEFSQFGLEHCQTLEEIHLPDALTDALRQELQSGFSQLALEPRANACTTLQRLARLCDKEASQRYAQVQEAQRLWPRLGGCLGALAAILLW